MSATVIRIAPVRKTVRVKASPQTAFEVFTAGIDRWWPKTHGIGTAPLRESVIEPFVGGRWYSGELGDQPYFVGGTMSLADVLLAPQLDFFAASSEWPTLTAKNANLVAWLRRMSARPSLEATTWEQVTAMARAS